MSTDTTVDTKVIEWGVRLTWPDGHVETLAHTDRRDAELTISRHGFGDCVCTAQLVRRTVRISAWRDVPAAQPTDDGAGGWVARLGGAGTTIAAG